MSGLRFVFGSNVNEDFHVFLDDVDVTHKLHIKSLSIDVSADDPQPIATLEMYVDGVDVLVDRTDVEIIK